MGILTRYRNTDLELIATEDLTSLAAAFAAKGMWAMAVTACDDGCWHATFETDQHHAEPQTNIAEMLAVVEALEPMCRLVWAGCSTREFNVGYDCGSEPCAFNQGLTAELLGRMAAAGASLRTTLYPDRQEGAPDGSSASTD